MTPRPDHAVSRADRTHLTRWRGHGLAVLGDAQAIDYLTRALDQLDPSFVRAQCALRADLAQAFHATGERDQARMEALAAKQLAMQIGSARNRRRVHPSCARLNSLGHKNFSSIDYSGMWRGTAKTCSNPTNEPDPATSPRAINFGTSLSGTHATIEASTGSAVRPPSPPTTPVHLMRSIHQSGHRLKLHDLHQIVRTPARFLHRLPTRRLGTCLARIHDPAWKFPPPRLRDETMPPHQQHPILIIQDDGYRHPLQPDNVMLKPIAVGRCDIHLRHPHPRTVKQRPLTMLTPHQGLRLLRAPYHGLTLTPTRWSTSAQQPH